MISNLSGTYEQKLRQLGLYTLDESRKRGDMIEVFKILTGKSKVDYRTWFDLAPVREGALNTRVNTGYLQLVEPNLMNLDIRRNFFTSRYPRMWNNLPEHI